MDPTADAISSAGDAAAAIIGAAYPVGIGSSLSNPYAAQTYLGTQVATQQALAGRTVTGIGTIGTSWGTLLVIGAVILVLVLVLKK